MGEHFGLADLLRSIPGSSSQAGSTEEPHAEIVEEALASLARSDQSPLAVQDPEPTPWYAKKKVKKKKGENHNRAGQGRRRGIRGLRELVGSTC